MNDMRIGSKILASFALVLLLVGVAEVLSYAQDREVSNGITLITSNTLPSTDVAGQILALTSRLRALHFQHVATTDDAVMGQIDTAIQGVREELQQALHRYEPMILSDDERRTFTSVRSALDEYIAQSERGLALSRRNENEAAMRVIVDAHAHNQRAREFARELVEVNRRDAASLSASIHAASARSNRVTLGSLLLAAALAAAVAINLSRRISRPVVVMERMAQRLAAGEVSGAVVELESADV